MAGAGASPRHAAWPQEPELRGRERLRSPTAARWQSSGMSATRDTVARAPGSACRRRGTAGFGSMNRRSLQRTAPRPRALEYPVSRLQGTKRRACGAACRSERRYRPRYAPVPLAMPRAHRRLPYSEERGSGQHESGPSCQSASVPAGGWGRQRWMSWSFYAPGGALLCSRVSEPATSGVVCNRPSSRSQCVFRFRPRRDRQ